MKSGSNRWLLLLFIFSVMSVFIRAVPPTIVATVYAQELSVAQPLPIATAVPNGSIVSYSHREYHLSSEPYDKTMVGVATTQPKIELKTSDEPVAGTYPVVAGGVVNVRVITENGPIKAGDPLTASSTQGIAMKATKTGFILGIAQADFTDATEGSIPVLLTIKFAFAEDSPTSEKIGIRLLDVLKFSGMSVVDDPVKTLRYLLAAGVVIVSLIVAFFTVGKVARGGVEAIGRNPLASRTITFSIILNIFFSMGIVGIGLAAAYVISTLGG